MEDLKEYIHDIEQKIKTVSTDRNYWLIRTMGGSYYSEFIRLGYVAIGYNEIKLSELADLPTSLEEAKEIIKDKLDSRRQDLKNTGYYASQILHFCRDVKNGDVVIIPSIQGSHVAIGIVNGNPYEDNQQRINGMCPFQKRRHVDWKSYSRKIKLPPSLQLIFNSRHAISNINSYATYIDSVIGDCYLKNNVMNLVIRIKTLHNVTFDDFMAINSINKMTNDICNSIGYFDESPVVIKVQMESPGHIKLSTPSILKMVIFGLSINALCGGGLKYETKEGKKFELYTKGIPGAINDYFDREADRELVRATTESIRKMNIDSTKDLEPIIELIQVKNEIRNKY